jgi:F-type H+-transporting ATPase subunit b
VFDCDDAGERSQRRTTMNINWSQLTTNILGFLLLFWGLKKWAWGPLLGFLDERRGKIEGDFERIREGQRENQSLKEEFESDLREIEASARKKIEEAVAEGNSIAAGIKEEAQAQARKKLDKARTDIEHERAKARVALRNDIVDMALQGAEKVLKKELQGQGQKEMVGRYIDDLEQEFEGSGA